MSSSFFYFIITTVSQSEQHVTSLPYIYTASLSAPAVGGETSWRDVQKFIFILNNARAQLFFFQIKIFLLGLFVSLKRRVIKKNQTSRNEEADDRAVNSEIHRIEMMMTGSWEKILSFFFASRGDT